MKNTNLYTLIVLLFFSCSGGGSRNVRVDLFNGKYLTGWVQRNGEAEFKSGNREIVGISNPGTPNSFLCTENVIHNYLSDREKEEGWALLFDGKTFAGWRGALMDAMPDQGWTIRDGAIEILPGDESGGGRDIVSIDQFSNFELVFDFKLSEGANSGLKYYVTENVYDKGALGPEYQILDDAKNPDALMGINGNRTLSSLYDIMPAKGTRFNGIDQWNTGRVVAKNNHIEHWLNNIKVLEYERGSDEYQKMVSQSKFSKMRQFGEAPEGHILLQHHNDRVWFRNLKIKLL